MPDKEQKKDKETDELNHLAKERDEYLSGWQRAKADLSNYKKDELKRLEEVARFANAEIMLDIVRVLDSFNLGLAAMEKMGEVEKGLYLIRSQLEDTLKKYGLTQIIVKEGEAFDPTLHDAIVSVEGSEEQDGQIAEELERGYTLYNKVLRAPKVKVFKKKAQI